MISQVIVLRLFINNKNIKITEVKTFCERLKGLIGKSNIDFGMLFKDCNGIHTFFMKEEIDVIGLNEKNEIIFIELNVKPNKIIKIHRNIKKTSILELPKNTCFGLKIGDKLFFIK